MRSHPPKRRGSSTEKESPNDHDNGNRRRQPPGLRTGAAVGARSRPQRAGLLRRPRRAEPVLDHRRHLPVGVPDHLGRRRAARRAADDRPQHPARGRRDRVRQRRQQQGHVPHLLAPPRRPRRRVVPVRQERHSHRPRGDTTAAAARRRPGQAAQRRNLPGPPHARDRRRADRPGLARRQPLARQHRHPPARPRHADADRHRQSGLGARVRRQPDRGHSRLHRGPGQRARVLRGSTSSAATSAGSAPATT